jgi:hypothetical protein
LRLGLGDDEVGRLLEALAGGGLALQQRLGLTVAPGLVGDAAERQPGGLDRVAVELDARRYRDRAKA